MKKYVLPLLFLMAALSSCVKDRGTTPSDTLKSILLGKDTLSMYQGDIVQLNYALSPSNYDPSKLVWTSSDTSVISIQGSTITAKKQGKTKITVENTVNTVSVSCLVTVIDSLRKGLIAYYPFNGTVGDSSGNGNNGTAFNITTVANRFGTANSACYFNGNNSYITVQDNQKLRLNNTDFTLNAWVYIENYGYSYGSSIFSKRIAGYNNGWSWDIAGYGSGIPGLMSYGPGGGSVNAISNSGVSTQNWHMLTTVYTYNDLQLSFYIDGVLNTRVSNILVPNPDINVLMYIGKDNPEANSEGYFFKGSLDDLRIYGRALKANAIKKLLITPY